MVLYYPGALGEEILVNLRGGDRAIRFAAGQFREVKDEASAGDMIRLSGFRRAVKTSKAKAKKAVASAEIDGTLYAVGLEEKE